MATPAFELMEIENSLPLWLVLVPLLGSFLVYWSGRFGEVWRNYAAILISLTCFLLAVQLFFLVQSGDVVYRLSSFMEIGLNFRVDMLGALFTLFASFIWLLATIFSWTYMDHEHARDRYYYFLTLSLSGCLGVFLMADFFGLLLFFELMSLASYVLVIHAETDEAMEAGRNYLYLGIIGGLTILVSIFILYYTMGTVAIAPLLESITLPAPLLYLVLALFIIGFGIKAGMAPLHIWLPKAHPVAPSPASALLSGIMIKTGAYGIIRVVNMLHTPGTPGVSLWEQTASLGYVIIWFGIGTMFMAAFIALFQTNAKRILAYSSISQMGYILMGVGCAAYLGYEVGAMGFSGTVYHIMNHAFFKAGMFMLVGAIYARTHQLELSKLGGLYLDFPVTAIAFFICACGIAGIPGFNGYASKTLLHHAIEDAFIHNHAISLYWAERIFTLTSAFTVCYITKLFTSIFFGPRPQTLKNMGPEPVLERVVFGIIALCVLILGLFPARIMDYFILPATRGFVYDSYKINYLSDMSLFTGHDLKGIAIAVGLGLFLFILFKLSGAFAYRPPAWLSVEGLLYRPVIAYSGRIFTGAGRRLENGVEYSVVGIVEPLTKVSHRFSAWEAKIDPGLLQPLLRLLRRFYTGTAGLLEKGVETILVQRLPSLAAVSRNIAYFDEQTISGVGGGMVQTSTRVRDGIYELWLKFLAAVISPVRYFFRRLFYLTIKVDYDPKGERIFQIFNVMNFDFDFILFMATLLLILGASIFLF